MKDKYFWRTLVFELAVYVCAVNSTWKCKFPLNRSRVLKFLNEKRRIAFTRICNLILSRKLFFAAWVKWKKKESKNKKWKKIGKKKESVRIKWNTIDKFAKWRKSEALFTWFQDEFVSLSTNINCEIYLLTLYKSILFCILLSPVSIDFYLYYLPIARFSLYSSFDSFFVGLTFPISFLSLKLFSLFTY